jgi:hypothetical protein
MAQATGTLAGLNEFMSDTPTDIDVVELRAMQIATAISTIADDLTDKLKSSPGSVPKMMQQETLAQVEALNRELQRLLEIKRRLENQKR